jgi:hypothetical protein
MSPPAGLPIDILLELLMPRRTTSGGISGAGEAARVLINRLTRHPV